MSDAVADAFEDSGARNLRAAVQWLGVVQGAWRYSDPARLIAQNLGLGPVTTALTTAGGQAPQAALNTLCQRISDGTLGCAILTGGETIWSRRRLRRRGERLSTTDQESVRPEETLGHELEMSTSFEIDRGADQPIVMYPIFESAIRASRGETIDAHRDRISRLWHRFNQVAVGNEYAWRRDSLTAEQIREASATNRMVGFPYTKAMNSNWDLDQASAIIVCSAEVAESAGVPRDLWVFPWAGGSANDTAQVSNRRDLHSSPAVEAIGRALFAACDLHPGDLDHVDLYSCFPSAVQIAAGALGLDLERQLTVTGGLTFAGGPLNNYVGHSIAAMTQTIRAEGGTGLVTANGGYTTKHALGLFRSDPPEIPFCDLDCRDAANDVASDTAPPVAADTNFSGPATIEGYTVMHDGDGPTDGVAALRTPEQARTWARFTVQADLLSLMADEGVGRSAEIDTDGQAFL